jgi:hypothetical protein
MKKFDEASAFFTNNQERLDTLKAQGILVKLRHNGTLRITRTNSGRKVFKKELTSAKGQTIAEFLEAGLNQADLVAQATVPPNIFSRPFSIFSRLFSR